MSESSPIPESSRKAQEEGMSSRGSGWKRAAFAGTLSLFFSGLGQLYNRQPRRALLFGIVSHLFTEFFRHTRVPLVFPTMIAAVLAQLLWKVFVVGDASYAAAKAKRPETPVAIPRVTYPALVVLLIAGTIWPSVEMVKEESGFRAFRITSQSMCPTICLGDRIIVDMNNYRKQKAQRGDLIVMKHASSGALFVKRVIGLPGDIVSPGPDGSVLVKGQPFRAPSPCAMPTWDKNVAADYSEFHETKVPDGNYFVVGDNLQSSYDSRYGEFGAVTADMIRGRPLYFYWSPTRARIGCAIH